MNKLYDAQTGPHEETGVHGCYLVHLRPDYSDDRGQLIRPFRSFSMEYAPLEVDDVVVRSLPNVFRGMHIQHFTAPQWKYVRVTSGSIIGAVVDTSKERRAGSFAHVLLSECEPKTGPRRDVGLLIPPWCAWGYYTNFGSDVTYRIWGKRVVEAERVIHYQSLGFRWDTGGQHRSATMSDRDRDAPSLSEVDTGW